MTGDPRDERIWAGLVARLQGVEAHIKEPPPWRGAEAAAARPEGVALGPTLVRRSPPVSRRRSSLRPVALGGAAVVAAVALVATLLAGPMTRDRFGASVASPASTPPSSEPSASSSIEWGPLAVYPPQDGADQARNEGTLRITDTCVTLERLGEVTLLTWPADRTTWDQATRAITFENFDGTVVTVADGDVVVVGGSGSGGESEGEPSMSAEEWIESREWVAPPARSCPLDERWGVGAIELAGASGPAASPITKVAEADGLKLVAMFDRVEVEPGGSVTVALRIENTRSTDVVFEEPCHPQSMTVEVHEPVEPIGREWDGIAAAFKSYVLETSSGSPMESSIRERHETGVFAQPCHARNGPGGGDGLLPTTIIPAGTTYETFLTWTAEIVPGVPALPGVAPFAIRVAHYHVAAGGGMTAATIGTSGGILVLDGAASAISAGQAIDAALGDRQFAAWLEKQPKDAWVNANLFLQPRAFAEGLPEVPYWDVELFREPRNWAILYIDAMTGEVLRRNFCDIPCDR